MREKSGHGEEQGGERNGRLRPGDAVYFKDDELHEGTDPQYYFPDKPDLAYAEADTFVAGRDGPELNGASEGCRIITLYNKDDKTGALIHVDASDIGSTREEELTTVALSTVPSLRKEGVEGQVFGDVETSPHSLAAEKWNDRLSKMLRGKGVSEVAPPFSEGVGKDVTLSTRTGKIEVRDDNGAVIYRHQPGKPKSRE